MSTSSIPPLPKGAAVTDDSVPPLPKGAVVASELPGKPTQPESKLHAGYRWLFGIGPEYQNKGLITHDLPEYGKRVAAERQNRRSSQQYYDEVQKKYQDEVSRIKGNKHTPATEKYLLDLAEEERKNRLTGTLDPMLEQFAPNALGTASKILGGSLTKGNVAAGAAAAKFPVLRPVVGAYYAYESGKSGLQKRQPNESEADYIERVLLGLSGVVGGAAVGKSAHLPEVTPDYRVSKLTHATGGAPPESLHEVLPDLIEQARKQGRPERGGTFGGNSIKRVQKYVDSSLSEKNAVFNSELQNIADQKVVPVAVANEIRGLIKPNWENTVEGQANIREVNRRAAEFDKPWSMRALNSERMESYRKTRSYKAKTTAAKMKTSPDLDLDIEQAIERSTKDLVYGRLSQEKVNRLKAEGASPEQIKQAENFFAQLKRKQSALLDVKSKLDDHVKEITKQTYQQKGKPITEGQTATISAHPGGVTPRMHGLGRFIGRKPLGGASKAARQAFKRLPEVEATKPSGLPPVKPTEPPEPSAGGPKTGPNRPAPAGSMRPAERFQEQYEWFKRNYGGREPTPEEMQRLTDASVRYDKEKFEPRQKPRDEAQRSLTEQMNEVRKQLRDESLSEDDRATFTRRLEQLKHTQGKKELPKIEPTKKKVTGESLKPWLDRATEEFKATNPGKKLDFRAIEKRALEMKKQGLPPLSKSAD